MENFEQTNPTVEEFKDLADKLDNLQKNENEGRGISCIKTIISCLNRDDVEGAKAICANDGDKIEQYEEIKQLLISTLFKEEDNHPWDVSDSF